jgi:hypothetical protein
MEAVCDDTNHFAPSERQVVQKSSDEGVIIESNTEFCSAVQFGWVLYSERNKIDFLNQVIVCFIFFYIFNH